MLDFISDLIAQVVMDIIMDRFYLNGKINVFLRLIFVLPWTAAMLFFGFGVYQLFTVEHNIWMGILAIFLTILFAWLNYYLVKNILKTRKPTDK